MWKDIFLQNRVFWWLTHDWDKSRNNWLARLSFLSYSAPAMITLQLPACFTCVVFWRVNSREPLARSNSENPLKFTHTLEFFTFSHTQLLHDSQLNTGYLANLAENKANTRLNRFNLTISPFGYSVRKP